MPRIRVWEDMETKVEDPGDNDPRDYCIDCWKKGQPPTNNSLAEVCSSDDHPPYSETDYVCRLCGKVLTDKDN
jgi:hypothetical protein